MLHFYIYEKNYLCLSYSIICFTKTFVYTKIHSSQKLIKVTFTIFFCSLALSTHLPLRTSSNLVVSISINVLQNKFQMKIVLKKDISKICTSETYFKLSIITHKHVNCYNTNKRTLSAIPFGKMYSMAFDTG